jgi:peptide/nickel transport system permease protein
MQRYLLIRFGQSLITLIGVSIIVFTLARMSGNPLDVLVPEESGPEVIEQISKLWGLDKPWHEQYIVFITNAARGDFGNSIKWQGQKAMDLVMQRFPATLQLASLALVVAVILAVPIGVLSAYKKGSWMDYLGKSVALLGQSSPSFWIGIMLIWVFAVQFRLLPTSGRGEWTHMILPGVALGWFPVAAFMRLIRSSMLTALDSEYVKLARLKGVPEWKIIWKHALKNAAIPPITFFGILVARLLTGSVAIETVFAWPGVGLLALEAVNARDYQVVQAVVMIVSGIFIFMNLLVDLAYAYVDPRVRLG